MLYNDTTTQLPDLGDRSLIESLLGLEYSPRACRSVGRVRRGTADIKVGDAVYACTVYSIDGGTYAQGLIYDRCLGTVRLILTRSDVILTQSELAEAVDFWESENDCRLYCLHEKSCGAVVFTGDGNDRRFLTIRMNLGHCGLPKGHIEKYETEQDAARREILEETGVRVTLLDGFRETVEYPISPKTRKVSVYFIGRFDGDDVRIQPSEVCGYKLCPYDEARRYITHDNDRAVFESAFRWLSEHEAESRA